MTWKVVDTSRTFSTSSIKREVIHAQGQSGSNQNSAADRAVPVVLVFSVLFSLLIDVLTCPYSATWP